MISFCISFSFNGVIYEAVVSSLKASGLHIFHVYNICPKLFFIDEPFTLVFTPTAEINWHRQDHLHIKLGEVIAKVLKPHAINKAMLLPINDRDHPSSDF